MTYTVHDFSSEPDISSQILTDFQQWHNLLLTWNKRINLVSKSALNEFWKRHALDSWQVTRFVPNETKTILDLGSGGGFPGLALAIAAKHNQSGQSVTLVESVGKKANFLRTVIRALELPANVKAERAESLVAQPVDLISARAFAPLPKLLTYAQPFWADDTMALLLKGQSLEDEIESAKEKWSFNIDILPSVSAPDGVVVKIHNLSLNH